MPGSHRIRRQRWRVRAPDRDQAFACRRRLRDDLDSVLLPAFERAFDAVAGGDEVIRIPRLEVQLRLDNMDQLAERLPEAIAAALARALEQPRPQAPAVPGAPPARPGAAARLSPAAGRRAALLHYLARGNVDWPQAGGDSAELAAGLRRAAAEWAVDWDEVRRAAPDQAGPAVPFFIRLLQLLDEPAALRLLASCRRAGEAAAEPGRDALPAALRALPMADLAGHERRRLQAVELAIAAASTPPSPEPAAAILAEWLPERALPLPATPSGPSPVADPKAAPAAQREEARPVTVPAPASARQAPVAGIEDGAAPAAQPAAIAGHGESARAASPALDRGPPPAVGEPAARAQASPPAAPAPLGARQGEPPPARAAAPEPDAYPAGEPSRAGRQLADPPDGINEGPGPAGRLPENGWPSLAAASRATAEEEASPALRVHAAGLVLLHPFIVPLFRERGMLAADGKSLAAGRLAQAAALLHWLATGRDDVFEFELGCIKLLLGLAPSQALPADAGLLDAADRAECAALLAAAVAHWPALRSTRADTLRLSFLQRRGLLRDGDAGWLLRIEPEAFDLLLSRLPWGISIVKLPWMTRPIFTDWPTP